MRWCSHRVYVHWVHLIWKHRKTKQTFNGIWKEKESEQNERRTNGRAIGCLYEPQQLFVIDSLEKYRMYKKRIKRTVRMTAHNVCV